MTDLAPARPLDTATTHRSRALRPVASPFGLRDERPGDAAARDLLLDAAFGAARFAKTCERLREGRLPAQALSLVAMDEGRLVGTLRFWHIDAGGRPGLMLGPLAVAASHRSAGIGRAMIEHGLGRARRLGHAAVILVGDAPYYGRFGFEHDLVRDLALPGPVDEARFLGLELVPGALGGARGLVTGTGLKVEPRGRDRLRRAA